MSQLTDLFRKDFCRPIETVIKADDRSNILQEVEEYVVTRNVRENVARFFEAYNLGAETNGVWISGFFGSGKSHLLKILSYVLENPCYDGKYLGKLFAEKVKDDAKLKGDIEACTDKYESESILFNIDQQAQVTSKRDENAILQVFYKVFYDHLGYYGFQGHVADFEGYLEDEGKYEAFKKAFAEVSGKTWHDARSNTVDPVISDAVAEACASIYDLPAAKYQDYLEIREEKYAISIENFAQRVKKYLDGKGKNARLNFLVDEVGQYIAENITLMTHLQTITESLLVACGGRSWVIVTSQEDLESLVGNDSRIQSDDFSKIQGRFKVRMPLTSANVDEVIEKRLLEKNDGGSQFLSALYSQEQENLKTLLTFSDGGVRFQHFDDAVDFSRKFPFVPYQFDLFQQCIKALSRHNAFQGRHASVGERSMLGVFQEVLKQKQKGASTNTLVSFDLMYEGLRASLRSEVQTTVHLAENQLKNEPLAVRLLKVLFLIKYYDSFKATAQNLSVLLLDDPKVNLSEHKKAMDRALILLEQQTYIERKGEYYEFLTDTEKDIENEIKDTSVDTSAYNRLVADLFYNGVIGDSKIRYHYNKQDFEYTQKVDGELISRERDLSVELVTAHSDNFDVDSYFTGSTMGLQNLMVIRLPEDNRLIPDLMRVLKTEKYIKQTQSASNDSDIQRILMEKGQQNSRRKNDLELQLAKMLSESSFYLNGTKHDGSGSSDGRTRFTGIFQELVRLAYPKLELVGARTYTEDDVRSIMRGSQMGVFEEESEQLNPAEQEVLNLLKRKKSQLERITIADIHNHFKRRPYGWGLWAASVILASLFKKGKIEAIQNTRNLDDQSFTEALGSNRLYGQTLLEPQQEVDGALVQRLKAFYKDLFNEPCPFNEAKEVANLFKQSGDELLKRLDELAYLKSSYPFVGVLDDMRHKLKDLISKRYVDLLEEAEKYEDALLDAKEDHLQPIEEFLNGGQKAIYDELRNFQGRQAANFKYVNAEDKEFLLKVAESDQPYKGNQIREAKECMESIHQQLGEVITAERDETIAIIQSAKEDLQKAKGWEQIEATQQAVLLRPLEDQLASARANKFIDSLKVSRSEVSSVLITQLSKLAALVEPDKPSKEKKESVQLKELGKVGGRESLRNAQEVDQYVEALRNKLLIALEDHKRIDIC